MKDVTVIYYSSNREDPDYERRIRENLLSKIGDLPLISVSQKPMPGFGDNIVVGDVGISDWNIYNQMKIACEKATTKWVVTAESDCLYPPSGYFDFIPPELPEFEGTEYDARYAYHYRNLWIIYSHIEDYWSKHFSLCGLYADRKYLLSRIYRSTKKRVKWIDDKKHKSRPLFNKFNGWTDFSGDLAIVNMKTTKGLRKWTGVTPEHRQYLEYWGNAQDLRKEWLL